MKSISELFPTAFTLISRDHESIHGGHDIYHALRVATWAQRITLEEWGDKRTAELAGLAGLCHNADRLLENKFERNKVPDKATEVLLTQWLLNESNLDDEEEILVVKAVIGHNKKNDPTQSEVQIALMDADKVVNMALDLVIRSGQLYHDLPAVDMEWYISNPNATYHDPGSCLKDIWYSPTEWVDPNNPFCFRTKLGQKVGKKRAEKLRQYISTLKTQLREDGIVFKS